MKGKKYKDDMDRHCRADGGSVEEGVEVSEEGPRDVYAGGDSPTVKAARNTKSQFKKGGKVSAFKRGEMSEGMKEHDEKKKMKKHGGMAEGEKGHHRADRAPRKAGGRVGRDMGGPISTAGKVDVRPNFKGNTTIAD